MPELPEVETVVRQLKPLIEGRKISHLEIHDEKLAHLDIKKIEGFEIIEVFRLGKQIVIAISQKNDTKWLAVHLRMTGRLLYHDNSLDEQKHIRLTFTLDKGFLYFQDTRRFGTVELTGELNDFEPAGIEPLSETLTSRKFYKMMEKSKQEIKPWLLRQDRLVGLGNIYASEILFAAKIHPDSITGELDYEDAKRIFRATRSILRKAIKHCGTTFSDFQNAKGEIGSFQNFLKVYGHEGEKCQVCGNTIEKLVQQQRSGFFCPNCQKSRRINNFIRVY